MLYNSFLTFHRNCSITTQKQLFTEIKNTFTIEFWAKPEIPHGLKKESSSGISTINNERFVIVPVFGAYGDGDGSRAGVGISVGTNGVSIYEHTINHLPATLVYDAPIYGWTHIAVVYANKKPTLYINGKFTKTGKVSRKKTVVPSGVFAGGKDLGFYVGGLNEIRIWNTARMHHEIQKNMSRTLTGNEPSLFGYWKLNEGSGIIAHDSTMNKHDGNIEGAEWSFSSLLNKRTPKKDMNILFTFLVPSGGIETLNRQRFNALAQKQINCHFLYLQNGSGLQNKINTSIFVTNNNDEIKSIILQGNYDAIVVASDLRLLQKIKYFGYQGILIYENQGLGFYKEYANNYLQVYATKIDNFCDAILYPQTPHLIQAFETYFPHKKKFCFHNCFNTDDFKYQMHPKKDNPIIGWVGRLEENKNWRDFLTIGSKLIHKNPSIQLWMFEDDTLSNQVERLAFERKIDELNLRNHLTMYVNQPHNKMAEYFSIIGDSGGFLCSTSKVEGFGYAVLEAMVCRCPVLSTDSDGIRSLIKHNQTGKFFDHGNIDQAALEGYELLTNIPLREEIRGKAVKHIETHFSPGKYSENFIKMIQDLKSENH
ncbi:glycosyltransferase [Peribacillus frigoritolerans]|uniref:glycosyltransferase n=1 Tax=Peribacillus frigoritolerans TaxID=450367 RepID=UPI0020C0DE77|nr:glycosyltransferase [Peribacillus frigoritolerans]